VSLIAPLQRANHGSHFRAYGLRGVGALIDPFLGVDHAWMSAPTFPPASAARAAVVDVRIGRAASLERSARAALAAARTRP